MNYNEIFKNATQLTARVAVYVPGTNGANTEADNSEYIKRTAAQLSEFFGGATAQECRGFWVSDIHGLIEEKTTVIYSNATPADLEAHAADILTIAETLKEELKQEGISVEINGALFIV